MKIKVTCNIEFDPCPFCGSDPVLMTREFYDKLFAENGGAMLNVECKNCNAQMAVYSYEDGDSSYDERVAMLARRWNTRRHE